MTHKLDSDEFFIQRIQQHCAERGMNFFLVEPLWAEAFLEKLSRGEVWARVLLNMHSEHHLPEDVFHRLVRLAHERNTRVIDPPDTALAAFNKARMHARLESAGVKVPATIVVPREQLTAFRLAEADRLKIGTPFVIKPSMGYGRRGVVLEARSEQDFELSLNAWPDAHYLLQRRVQPHRLNGSPAYFRVYHVFGDVWCSWWNPHTDNYRQVTPDEMEQFSLRPLREIVLRIAEISGMRFFSSEITLTETGEWVVIDYVNDQCHLLTQSASPHNGVPDELVGAIARRLVEAAREMINGRH